MISGQGFSFEYKHILGQRAMHYCWRESIEVLDVLLSLQSKDADAIFDHWHLGGKEKEIHVHLRNSKIPWPLICQSFIQPIICTMKTGCKTSQVNRNRIKHNSFIPLNMVTEQTRWQGSKHWGKTTVCILVWFNFPLSQTHSFAGKAHLQAA